MSKKQFHAPQQSLFDDQPSPSKASDQLADGHDYALDLVDAVSGPIITFSRDWADTMPERILNIVTRARLKALLTREHLATDVDCMLYIYTRTLIGPMDYHWTNIYLHLSCKTLSEWFDEDRWEAVDAPRELTEWEQSILMDLRRRIYETRRKVLKHGGKQKTTSEKIAPTHSRPEPTAGKQRPAGKQKTPSDQPSLF